MTVAAEDFMKSDMKVNWKTPFQPWMGTTCSHPAKWTSILGTCQALYLSGNGTTKQSVQVTKTIPLGFYVWIYCAQITANFGCRTSSYIWNRLPHLSYWFGEDLETKKSKQLEGYQVWQMGAGWLIWGHSFTNRWYLGLLYWIILLGMWFKGM